MAHAFEAQLTFDGDEMERSETKTGEPYIRLANVTVETEYETLDRTVMAFGDMTKIAEEITFPKKPAKFLIEDRGRTFVIVGRAA